MKVDHIPVADVAYPHITTRVLKVFRQQLIHVRNGCISDDSTNLPFVKVGTVNFHNSGHHLAYYQSLRGTSKVESVHSVLDRTFIHKEVLEWRFLMLDWLGGYWGNTEEDLGHLESVPPDTMPPKVSIY